MQLLLPGWRLQFGKWTDGTKTDRYAVIKPMAGLPIELVRRPQFSLILIAGLNDPATLPNEAAEAVIQAMLADTEDPMFMQPGEPVPWFTDDGRPVAEISIQTITD
ncbi:phage tail termination protein [Pseudacidovorax intermedius]|uniref:phage tail termination protein n=1 Tax=Pseudacidovorax intermedius TaxID=433924 RepID=UPI001FA7CB07|nr:hypothetical protein [Pseudacidovorax intermedius]